MCVRSDFESHKRQVTLRNFSVIANVANFVKVGGLALVVCAVVAAKNDTVLSNASFAKDIFEMFAGAALYFGTAVAQAKVKEANHPREGEKLSEALWNPAMRCG